MGLKGLWAGPPRSKGILQGGTRGFSSCPFHLFFGQDKLLVPLQSALDRLGRERDTRGLGDEDGAGLVIDFRCLAVR